MDAIAGAVAVEGFAELAAVLRDARETDGLSGIAHAYLEYAEQHPAVYEAMFVRRTDLIFGGTHTPEPLQTAFAEILAAVQPYARGDAETATEVSGAPCTASPPSTPAPASAPTTTKPA
jgi:hypothetical protein